jgi:hypothetical protein
MIVSEVFRTSLSESGQGNLRSTPLGKLDPVIRLSEGNSFDGLSAVAQNSRIPRRLPWPRTIEGSRTGRRVRCTRRWPVAPIGALPVGGAFHTVHREWVAEGRVRVGITPAVEPVSCPWDTTPRAQGISVMLLVFFPTFFLPVTTTLSSEPSPFVSLTATVILL